MNTFAIRFQVWLGMALALVAHAFATDSAPNTPEGMLVYHGSGALMDWLFGMVISIALIGKRGRVMRYLLLAAICTNFAGWLLYMAYVSPIYYNATMWGLTCAQCVCLFYPDRNDATDPWHALVRYARRSSGSNYSGA